MRLARTILILLLIITAGFQAVVLHSETTQGSDLQAIQKRHVLHLKALIDGSDHVASPYRGEQYALGATALVGLALAQANALDKDVLLRLTKYCTETVTSDELVFNLAFAALFLSEYGKPKTSQMIANRLIIAQQETGMWGQ